MATLTSQKNNGNWKAYPNSSDYSGTVANLSMIPVYLSVQAGGAPSEDVGVPLGGDETITLSVASGESLYWKPKSTGQMAHIIFG